MVIDSKYIKTFKSNDLTRQKYDELYAFAVMLRDHKNIVSEYVNSNLEHYLEYSRLDFLKEMRAMYKDVIPSSFDVQLYTKVFNCYQNKFEAIRRIWFLYRKQEKVLTVRQAVLIMQKNRQKIYNVQ